METAKSRPEVEFNAPENAAFSRLATLLWWVAVCLLVTFGVETLTTLLGIVRMGKLTGNSLFDLATSVGSGLIAGALGKWHLGAAASFRQIVATQGHDRANLMGALDNLRRVGRLQCWLIAGVLLFLAGLWLLWGIVR